MTDTRQYKTLNDAASVSARSAVRARVRGVTALADELGLTVPAATRRSVELYETAAGYSLPRPNLPEAVFAALRDGDDVIANVDVQTALAVNTAVSTGVTNELADAVSDLAYGHYVDTLAGDADTLVAAAQRLCAPAAATLDELADTYGDHDLGDTQAWLRADAGGAWGDLHNAAGIVAAASELVAFLDVVLNTQPGVKHGGYVALSIADIPPDDVLAGDYRQPVHPWDLARAGWSLELAAPGEYRRRRNEVLRLAQNRAQETAAAAEAEAEKMRTRGQPAGII